MKEFTTKDKLLHVAAQIDQLQTELKECQKDLSYSLSANHRMGVVMSLLSTASKYLMQIA